MPDRPAGAVEGTQDTDSSESGASESGALEAMMAAVFFRPAPAELTEVTSVVSVSVASAAASPTPVETVALGVVQMVEATEETPATSIDAPTADAASEAMRAAAQAALVTQRASARGKSAGAAGDADANPTFEIDTPTPTMSLEQDETTPLASVPDSTETASTPLGLLEGMSDVEVVEVTTSKPAMRLGVVTEDEGGETGTRTVLVAASASMVEGAVGASAPAAATKASGVQSLPVAAQVAETVRGALMRGDHEIRLILNPGDLGQIDIRIVEQGGALHLRLEATKGSTHDLLAREMPLLRQALEMRDLRVERIQVSHSGAGSASADGSESAWQQGFGRQGQQREHNGPPAWSPVASLDGARDEYGARRAPRLIRHQGVSHHGVLDRVA